MERWNNRKRESIETKRQKDRKTEIDGRAERQNDRNTERQRQNDGKQRERQNHGKTQKDRETKLWKDRETKLAMSSKSFHNYCLSVSRKERRFRTSILKKKNLLVFPADFKFELL